MGDKVGFSINPQPKTKETSIDDYIAYFERVMNANGWNDESAAKIFPSLLEVGNRYLDSVSKDDLEKFSTIKKALTGGSEPYREANLNCLFSSKKKYEETMQDYRDRVLKLIDLVYPDFEKENRMLLCRDFFIHGLPNHLKSAVTQNSPEKLDDAVNAAMLADSMASMMKKPYEKKKPVEAEGQVKSPIVCSFCKKPGHHVSKCYKKEGKNDKQTKINVKTVHVCKK